MDKMKKYLIYILILVGLALITNLLMWVSLNSSYKQITRLDDNLYQVVINQAEASKIDGRMKGVINNNNDIDANYLKIDFYSSNDVKMGTEYVEIKKEKTETLFEITFQLDDVKSYKLSFVNGK